MLCLYLSVLLLYSISDNYFKLSYNSSGAALIFQNVTYKNDLLVNTEPPDGWNQSNKMI